MTERRRLAPVSDAEPALWLASALEKPWGRGGGANCAAAVIPRGFAAYARLFHPAYLASEGRDITWAETAARAGTRPHARMQWHAISRAGDAGGKLRGLVPPEAGLMPEWMLEALVGLLERHTRTAGRCFFAVWDGWGLPELATLRGRTAHFRLWDRGYYLMEGDIRAALERISPLSPQHASIWWPEDRAWCVATEVDFMWTYVGGPEACVAEILADQRLEAWRASPDDRADANGDDVNAPRCTC
jgi:hypothetical protein